MDNNVYSATKIGLSILGGAIASWFGEVVPMVILVAVFLVFDYLTGMLAAGINKELESGKGFRGLVKKIATLSLLLLGLALDWAISYFVSNGLNLEMSFTMPFGLIICAWIVINEAISIVENLVKCGVHVPTFLVKLLKITVDKIDRGEGKC